MKETLVLSMSDIEQTNTKLSLYHANLYHTINSSNTVMHRTDLIQRLRSYRTSFIEEASMVERSLRFVLSHENCFDRNLAHGHVTGSAWVINPARTHTLMLHHRKLDRWLQPGGHADGDPDMMQVVFKETSEESGIDVSQIKLLDQNIFDVDIHTIYPSAHDHRHIHYDIRFLVEIDDQLPLPGNTESHQVAWIRLWQVSHYNNLASLHRMVRKTLKRFHTRA